MFYRIIIIFLIVLSFSGNITAQEPELSTVVVGDTIQVTLNADEVVRYLIDLEAWQSVLLTTQSNIANSVFMYNPESLGGGSTFMDADAESDIARMVAGTAGTYTIEIKNKGDIPGDITLTITDVETHALEIGERYSFDADQFGIFEITFDSEVSQTIVLELSSPLWRYNVEGLTSDGRTFTTDLNFDPVIGRRYFFEDTTYRMVVMDYTEFVDMTGRESFTEGYVEIREAEHFSDEIAVDETVEGTAPTSLFSYTLDLEQYQGVSVTFASNGAQTYISDEDDNVLAYFWHGNVTYALTQMTIIAPETATYTIHAYIPDMGNLFRGDFTLSVEEMDVMTLTDDPVTVQLTMDLDQLFITKVEADQQYELIISNEEQAFVRVYIYEFGEDTLIHEGSGDPESATRYTFDLRDAETITYPFETQQDGMIGIQMEGFNSIDVPITIQLQAVDAE